MTPLKCWECKSVLTGCDMLVPVTDGQVFEVACVHKLPRLRRWRRLTATENEQFEGAGENLIAIIRAASLSTADADPPPCGGGGQRAVRR